jgi:hypothetical protein
MPLHTVVHLILHLALPLGIARLAGRDRFRARALAMLAGLAIDLDHLLARPIFVPGRCSIGRHPLHGWPTVAVAALLLIPRRTRWLGVGLLLHLGLDLTDCAWMRG